MAPPTAPPIPLAPLRGELRYELNAPQRLGAIVVIATVSALLLLLLLFGVSELTQLFEQLTAS